MSVLITEVAEKAGVSTMTVSRVLNGSNAVSEQTRQKVLRIIAELGYIPSSAARSLRSKDVLRANATNCFALIFGADTQNADEFFCDVARGVEQESAKHGLCPLHVHWQESFASSWPRLQTVLSITGMCGAILAGQFGTNDIRKIQKHTRNVVILDGPAAGDVNIASVESDNLGGCKLALTHLAERGCRRILVITGPRTHYFTRAMEDSVKQTAGLFDCIDVHAADYTLQGGKNAIAAARKNGTAYDGIFSNDIMALGATCALLEAGIEIPRQVKVIGFDNIVYSGYSRPALSTVDIDKSRLGEEGVKTLIELIRSNQEAPYVKKVIPARLITRQSTLQETNA